MRNMMHLARVKLPWPAMAAALVLLSAFACTAQTPAAPAPEKKPRLLTEYGLPGLDKKISLDLLEAMDVVDLLKFLATKADLNVIIGREVTGTTKLMLKDVSLGDALEIVLAANGLAYEVKGNIVKVMSDKEYRDLHGEGFYERKQAKIVDLKYAVPSRMAQLLENIKSSLGKIVFDDTTGALILIDTPEKIREMESVIQKAELPTMQRILPTVNTNFILQYGSVEEIEPKITPMLTKDVGEIRTDKRTKTLIITDLPHVLAKIGDVIALFDREQQQVFIEAKIVDVKLSDSFSYGVNWDYLFQGMDPRFSLAPVVRTGGAVPLGLNAISAVDNRSAGGSLKYHTIAAGSDLNAVVEALSTVGKTRILQNAHVTTIDGNEATVKAITTQPYSEQQYESGSTNIVGKTYKFVDVGVTLNVTPHINELGFITCDIKPEVSSILSYYDSVADDGNSGVPVVRKSYSETSVSVKDGVTIIIGGMIQERESKGRTQVPFLGSIPLLGVLFRSETTVKENTETVVLLTPRIVTGTKSFERSKDMKKPVKADIGTSVGLTATEMTP